MTYFENAATTKPGKKAIDIFTKTAEANYGNPSSLHRPGKEAKVLLEKARCEIASSIGAGEDEIFFTAGGTEAANLAILGICAARREKRKIIISAVEHPAVFKTCSMLKKNGYKIVYIPVSLSGAIDEEVLAAEAGNNVALVSFMSVNTKQAQSCQSRKLSALSSRRIPAYLFIPTQYRRSAK